MVNSMFFYSNLLGILRPWLIIRCIFLHYNLTFATQNYIVTSYSVGKLTLPQDITITSTQTLLE